MVQPWIPVSAALCGVAVCGSAVCLTLLFRAKRRILAAEERLESMEAKLAAWKAEAASLGPRVRELEQQMAALGTPAPPPAAFNLSKRAQALRMHRRGDSPQQISGSLAIPAEEVELLLKVQRITGETRN